MPSRGHEQHDKRYGVVVQSDDFLPRSTVLVAPTSTRARPATFRPEADLLGVTTRIMVEQLAAIDTSRLGNSVGRLTTSEQWAVDDALELILGPR